MDIKSQKKFVENAYDLGDKRIEEGYGWPLEVDSQFVEFVKEIKKSLKSGITLDLGCGQGRHAIYFAKSGFNSYGIDYIERAIREAKQEALNQEIDNVSFEVMDVINLGFPNNFFDIVLDWSVLDHIKPKDWLVYTQGISRVLKSGGYLILAEFSANDERVKDNQNNFFENKDHYDHYFKVDEIKNLFSKDFEIIRANESNLKSKPKHLMLNILLRKK